MTIWLYCERSLTERQSTERQSRSGAGCTPRPAQRCSWRRSFTRSGASACTGRACRRPMTASSASSRFHPAPQIGGQTPNLLVCSFIRLHAQRHACCVDAVNFELGVTCAKREANSPCWLCTAPTVRWSAYLGITGQYSQRTGRANNPLLGKQRQTASERL